MVGGRSIAPVVVPSASSAQTVHEYQRSTRELSLVQIGDAEIIRSASGSFAAGIKASSFDKNGHFFRDDRWLKGKMLGVAEHELQGIPAGGQFNSCLGLPRPEMNMVLVLWNRVIWIERFVHVD